MKKYTDKWIEQELNNICNIEQNLIGQEKCIQQLPDVKRQLGVIYLVTQQISYIPKYVYIVLAMMYIALVFFAIFADITHLEHMMYYFSGALTAAIGLLLAVFNITRREEIIELEMSCKFGHNQVFLARIFWLIVVAIVYDFALYILISGKYGSGFSGMHAMILVPTLFGCCIALFVGNHLGYRRNESLLIVFVSASLLGNFVFLFVFIDLFSMVLISLVVCIALLAVLAVQCRNMLKGIVWYEAYSI